MSVDENKTIVRRIFDEVVNGANLDALDALVAEDVVTHTSIPGVLPGRAGYRAFVGIYLSAFPQQHTEVHQLIAEGDCVAALHTHYVTHGGDFAGMPPSGKQATVEGIEIFRIADGKVVEFWHHDDLLSLMQQLGAIPARGQ
jgi:steroid delta-isomerase-like uncharacterized protein